MPKDRHYAREISPAQRDRSTNKRKHRDVSEDAPTLPAKKKIQLAAQKRKEHDYPSVNELKRRIRAVKRLLEKVDLPADARVVQERALAGYEKDLEDEMQRRARSQMIKKYHFVRFLDRKSATKTLNRLLRREKELTSTTSPDKEALDSLRKKIHVARVNLNYTIYYPLNDKYISLYAETKQKKKSQSESGAEGKTDEDTQSGADELDKTVTMTLVDTEKPAMWYTVEKCMEEGTLDLLREGKLNTAEGNNKSTRTKAAPEKQKDTKMAGKEAKKSAEKTSSRSKSDKHVDRKGKQAKRATKEDVVMRDAQQDGEESDGGFFEM